MNPFVVQLIASLFFAIAMVKDKSNLRRFKIEPRDYTFMIFVGLTFFAGIVTLFTLHIDVYKLAEPKYYFGLIALIFLAFLWNKLFYYFENKEQLQDFEVMNLVVPAVTAAFAGLIFIEERSTLVTLAVLVSLATLYASQLSHHHVKFNAYSKLILVMIFAMAAESILRKELLVVFDPASLYFVRTLLVTVLLYMFYRPNKIAYSLQVWGHSLVSSSLGAVAMIMMFYGYRDLGIVLTTLVFVSSPLMVYFLDATVLGERIKSRNIIASVIILTAITIAAIYG